MDKVLLDNLIDIVINDNEIKNTYDNFDKLLLTLSEEEIIYFIIGCGESIFKNINLFTILIEKIPDIFSNHINMFIDNKLKHIEEQKNIIEEEYKNKTINQNEYNDFLNKYNIIKNEANQIKFIYIFEILKNLNK
jgi:hypothetical protein